MQVMLDGAKDGVLQHLDAGRSALQLEMLAEAERNDKFAYLLKQKDDIARAPLRDILTSERNLIKDISTEEMIPASASFSPYLVASQSAVGSNRT